MKIDKESLIQQGFKLIPATECIIEKDGIFDDEYVYDIEVSDGSHMCVVNNLLVHNSIYVKMDGIIQHLFNKHIVNWNDGDSFNKIKNYVDTIFQEKLNTYCADFICNKFHTDQRRIEFKREKLSAQAEFTAKKHYILHVYNDEGLDINKWAYAGVEIKKNELPESIKTLLKECVEGLIEFNWDNTKFQSKVREIFDIYEKMSIKDVAFIKNLNTPKESRGFLTMEKGAGAHAKAAEFYNQIIRELNITSKCDPIQPGDRFHYIYIKSNNKYGINVIGFKDQWPTEFDKLFELDINKMFTKCVIAPLKQISINHNYSTFDPTNILIEGEINLFDL